MFGQSLLSGAFGSSILDPGLNFDTKLYTGNGSDLSIGGKINGDASFNTSSSYIDSLAPLPPTSAISFWFKTSSNPNDGNWVNLIDNGGSMSAQTGVAIFRAGNGGFINLYFTNGQTGQSQLFTGTTNICDGQWHNIVLSLASDDTFVLYLDGTSHLSGTRTRYTQGATPTFSYIRFGQKAGSVTAGNQLYGSMDQIRIYNSSLSASEAIALNTETSATASTLDFPASAGCIAAYTLDTNSAPIGFDATTNVSTCDFPSGASALALYQFDDNVNDTCGSYNASNSNVTYTTGIFNKAGVFNGSSSSAEFPSMGTAFINDYSLSAWFKLDAYAGSSAPAYNLATIVTTFTDAYGWVAVSTTSKKLKFSTEYLPASPWGYAIESTSTIELDVWYHMVVTKSSTTGMKMYINGTLETTQALATQDLTAGPISTYRNCWGMYGSQASNQYSHLDGEIDQGRIFNSVLTQSQVTELVRGGEYYATSTDVSYPGFLNFQPDLTWVKSRTYGYPNILGDSVRGLGNDKMLISDFTGGEGSTDNNYANAQAYGYISSLDTNGFSTKAGTTNSSYVSNAGDYVSWNWKAGADIYAGVFNGSNSTLNTTWTHSSTTFSASCWVKFSVPTTETIITTTDDSAGAGNDGFTIAAHKCWLNQNDAFPYTAEITYTATVNNNKWHNIVVTNDGTTFKVYIDGNLDGSVSSTGWTDYGTNPLVMGYQPRNPVNQWYTGELDQIRMFTTTLSASQVTSLYNEAASDNTTLNFPAGAGCTAAYTLNKTANDVSGNYNGTASNLTYAKSGYTGRNNDGSIESQVSANQDAGFSIIKYKGVQPGSGNVSTIGHGLKKSPELIITKVLNSSNGWPTLYYKGSDKFCVRLDQTGASDANNLSLMFGNGTNAVAPTSSVYTVGNSDETNYAYDYIAYAWHSVAKYSKIGTYTATQTAGSPTITTDFEPAWVMLKNVDRNQEWVIIDSARGNNPGQTIQPNSPGAESSANSIIFNSTGFIINTTGQGNNYATGDTMIYIAFAVPLTT